MKFPKAIQFQKCRGQKIRNLLDISKKNFKPKAIKITSIIDWWTKSKQNSTSLNEWITKVYNIVEFCKNPTDWEAIKDSIIRDVLIVDCSNSQTKDKIIRKEFIMPDSTFMIL